MEAMAKQRIYTKPFSKAVDHYVRMNALTNLLLGLAVVYKNDQMIQAIRSERSNGEETKRRKIAEYFGFTLDEFIKEGERLIREQNSATLSATLPSPTMQAQASNVKSMHEHHALIDQFQDKETALEINHMLLVIEREDPKQLEKIKKVLAAFMPETGSQKKRRSGNGET